MLKEFKYLLVASLLAATTAGAAVVNIDFQFGQGATTENAGTVIPSPGTYWNTNRSSGQSTPVQLLSSLGEATGLEMVTSMYDLPGNPDGSGVYHGYVGGFATISGLTPGHDYHIVIYGAANIQNSVRVEQPFDLSSPVLSGLQCSYGHTAMPGVEGCDWFEGQVAADAVGEVTVQVFPGAISGLQLAPNPEPSVLLLNAIAGLGAALRRRRSN